MPLTLATEAGTLLMNELSILAVDDELDNLDLIEDALSGDEFRLYRAHSGTDAMSVMLSQRLDVVLLDIMMPDMNGFAVLEIIRMTPRLQDISVIVQTGCGYDLDVQRTKELGVSVVLHKPYSIDQLRDAVRACGPSCCKTG